MTTPRPVGRTYSRQVAAWAGLSAALVLIAAAMIVPVVTGLNVHQSTFPPLHASWRPRVGPGTVSAIALARTSFRVPGAGGASAARCAAGSIWP